MKVRYQKAWVLLFGWLVLSLWVAAGAELRTWTFGQDGQMHTSADGTVSFKKKGRLDAAFVRLATNNVILLAPHGGYVTLAMTNLCEADRSYLTRLSGLEESEAAWKAQSALVKNEMARRRREAAKLKEDAAEKRRLAQVELNAADSLENEAARLSGRTLEDLAQRCGTNSDSIKTNSSPLAGLGLGTTNFAAGIAAGAADQLAQDVMRLRHQAQDKRDRAGKLQREAAVLERTAQSEDADSRLVPSTPR